MHITNQSRSSAQDLTTRGHSLGKLASGFAGTPRSLLIEFHADEDPDKSMIRRVDVVVSLIRNQDGDSIKPPAACLSWTKFT